MAKFQVGDGFWIDMAVPGGGGGTSTIINATPTGFRWDFNNGNYIDYEGENIMYDPEGFPESGKLSSETFYLDGDLFYRSTDWDVDIEKLNKKNSFFSANKYIYRKDDKFFGNDFDDRLLGWRGNDVLKGAKGNDFLSGGADNDKLFGQEGRDSFHFARDFDKDVVKDFERKKDDILLEKGLAKNFDAIAKAASNYKHGLKLDFGKGDILKIEGVSKGKLDKIDFQKVDYDFA